MNADTIPTRHSITFRLTAAISALLLVFQVVLAAVGYYYFKHEYKNAIASQQMSLLTVISQEIDQKLLASRLTISEVAKTVPMEATRDSNAAQRFLDNRPGTLSHFDNGLYLFSLEGKIIAESPFRPNRRGRDISYREYYKRIMASGEPGISTPFISTHTPGAPTVMFTAPVRDENGRMVAIMGGSLNLLGNNFIGNISQLRIATSGYVFLTTSDRTLIMHPDKSRILKEPAINGVGKILGKALTGFAGTEETVNSRGRHLLTSFKRLSAIDWIIGVNYPADEAYASIWQVQKYFLLIIALGTLLFMIAVKVLMKRFTSTLVRFADHVRHISAKSGEERLFNVDSSDEVGTLVRTFNEMIQNVDQQNDILLHVSTHDALTGLYNRSYFDSEMNRLGRGRVTPISIVVADIDDLKECNDSVGHAAGDSLIKAAARLLLESFRAEDIVARIGGDEFAILLPGLDQASAEMTMERIRNALLKMEPIAGPYRLSISLGCAATATPHGLENAFRAADKQMYLDKISHKRKTAYS